MKKIFAVLALFMILITACQPSVKIQPQTQEAQQPTSAEPPQQVKVNTTSPAEFKLSWQEAIRNPPVVRGGFKNIGLEGSPAKVTARVYYAGVVASERTQDIDYVGADETANFSISFDTTVQWTAYTVNIEKQ